MLEPSIFTRIIKGEIPAHRIYEDDRVIAFLTICPLARGHTLVVPKKQIDQIWDLSVDDYDNLWKTAQKIAIHLRTVMKVDKVGVVIKGFEVPHAHIHLIPVSSDKYVDFDPEPSPPMADNDELAIVAKQIQMN